MKIIYFSEEGTRSGSVGCAVPLVGARRFIVGPMNSRGKQRVGDEGEVRKLLFTNQGKLEVTDIED